MGTRLVMVLLKHSYLNLGFMFKATMVRVRSKLRNIPSRLSSCQFFFQPYNQSHHSLEHDDTYDCFVLPFFIIIANHAGYTGTARSIIVTSHTSRCANNCSATYRRMSCYISLRVKATKHRLGSRRRISVYVPLILPIVLHCLLQNT